MGPTDHAATTTIEERPIIVDYHIAGYSGLALIDHKGTVEWLSEDDVIHRGPRLHYREVDGRAGIAKGLR